MLTVFYEKANKLFLRCARARREREQIAYLRGLIQDGYERVRRADNRRPEFFRLLAVLDTTLEHRSPDLSYEKLGALRRAVTEAQMEARNPGIPIDARMSRYDRVFFRKVEELAWLRSGL